MNRPAAAIMLENQHRRFLAGLQIFLDDKRSFYAAQCVFRNYIIGHEFSKAVPGHDVVVVPHKRLDAAKDIAHPLLPPPRRALRAGPPLAREG